MSWQMKMVNGLSRIIVKPAIRRAAAARVDNPLETLAKLRHWVVKLDNFLSRSHQTGRQVAGQPSYLWIDEAPGATKVVLYLHGGGMVINAPGVYLGFTHRLSAAVRARVLLIDYRLAPEHPYPAANDDCFAAYRWLIEHEKLDARQIVIAGDSAGGYLTLATVLRILGEGLPRPAGAIALSPITDYTFSSDSLFTNEGADPMLSNRALPMARRWVLNGHPATDPMVSPVYADLTGFPPVQIHVSSNEILRDDGVRFADNARRQGVDAELIEWRNTTHVHPLLTGIPESTQALAKIVSFINAKTAAAEYRSAAAGTVSANGNVQSLSNP